MDNQEILTRARQNESERTTVQSMWDAIERYIAPYRGRFFTEEKSELQVEWIRPYVYDSTAIHASQDLAAFVQSQLTSFTSMWFGMRFRNKELRQDQEAREWLEACSEKVFHTLEDSNFVLESAESYQDLVDFGTSFLCEEVEKDEKKQYAGVDFTSIPIKEAFFDEDYKGRVENFYRKIEWTPLQMMTKFGEEGLPECILELCKDEKKATEKKDVYFCIFRRHNISKEASMGAKKLAPEKRPYGYKYVLADTADMLGEEGGYYEMPVTVPRWRKTSSSRWGNSPAMIALADVLTLNRVVEMQLEAAAKAIDPPYKVTERSIVSDVELEPGGLTVVRDQDGIQVMPQGMNFDVSMLEIQRLQDSIRRYFHVDQIMLPPMQGTPATATEINMRWAQVERIFGPTFGRLKQDFLDPLIERTFYILWREDQLPEPPESLHNIGELEIEYTGPMARSQRQSDVSSIERWIIQIAQLAQVNPAVMDVPDWDALPREVGEMMGVPARLMKSTQEVTLERKKREKREQQQQAMMQMQMQQAQSQTAENFASAEQKRNDIQ